MVGGNLASLATVDGRARAHDLRLQVGCVGSAGSVGARPRGRLRSQRRSKLRVDAQCRSAHEVAEFLSSHPAIERTLYPMLDSHPQVELARRQMTAGGTLVSFVVRGGKAAAFRVLNRLRIVDISNNLGDSKSLICHPATTTHQRLPADEWARLGIGEGALRLSVGLEDTDDLVADLRQALEA